jgi:ferredoxin-thioredoxin reductase catalytic subunit
MPTEVEILGCIDKLRDEGAKGGYNLNPNLADLKMIIEGYLENDEKFGYPACPCRLASGKQDEDMDIICPCIYRDDDISEFGSCYCCLYVDDEISNGTKEPQPIPERRPSEPSQRVSTTPQPIASETSETVALTSVPTNVWRCPVCGYLAAKDQPPPKCPICGVPKDRFELFLKAG